MLIPLALAFSIQAQAGELQVALSYPAVGISVDGVRYVNPNAVLVKSLSQGTYRVAAFNALGKELAVTQVKLSEEERVRLRYKSKKITELGRGEIVAQTVVVAPPPVAEVNANATPIANTPPAATNSVATPPAAKTSVATSATVNNSTTQQGLSAQVTVTESTQMEASVPGASVNMSVQIQESNEVVHHAGVQIQESNEVVHQGRVQTSVAQPKVGPTVIDESSLVRLIDAVEDATFGDDQVDTIRTAGIHHHFRCDQVTRLIAPLNHSSDRVEAVTAIRGAIVDPQNFFVLESSFVHSSDKEAVRRLFQ